MGCRPIGDLFTPRQLVALTTFSDLVKERGAGESATRSPQVCPMMASRSSDGGIRRDCLCGCGWRLLGFAISRLADYNSRLVTWKPIEANRSCRLLSAGSANDLGFAEVKPVGRVGNMSESRVNMRRDSLSSLAANYGARPGFATNETLPRSRQSMDKVSPPIRPITTTSATLISRISSTCGCVGR